MPSDKDGAFWSAAGPATDRDKRLAVETRARFNEAARGQADPGKGSPGKGEAQGKAPPSAGELREAFAKAARGAEREKPDKAQPTHDLEPTIREKRDGAAQDREAASRKQFEHHTARARDRSRDPGLGR